MKMVPATGPKVLRSSTPADPFRELQHVLNRLFGSGFTLFFPEREEIWSLMNWSPVCDIYENENEIVVKAELPEVKKDDVHVEVENNVLTIRGERRFEEEAKRENYHRVERSYGEFMRSFTLPTTVDTDKINAGFKDGVLRLVLPKRAEAKPKQIEVKVK
jgi:HSP20 family protein